MNSNVYHITYFPKTKTVCLYFDGCNFRCIGCIRRKCSFNVHLPSTQIQIEKKFLSIDEILNILNKVVIKKIIFLGGEPTTDPNFIFLSKILKEKFKSYNVLLTNGYNSIDLSWIDEVCVSIKTVNPKLHKEYTGCDLKPVLRNLKRLNKEKIFLRTESIFIPGYIDIKETEDIACAISKINPNIPHRIDGYIPVPGTEWRKPNLTDLEEAVRAAKKYLKKVDFIRASKSEISSIKILTPLISSGKVVSI